MVGSADRGERRPSTPILPRKVAAKFPPPEGFRPNVGIFLLSRTGLVFVGRRIDTPNAWQMPQGGIDAGEAPIEAAWREMEEEVGTRDADLLIESDRWLSYEFPADVALNAFKGNWRGQAQRWFAFRYLGDDGGINIATAHPEFDAWRWVPRSELLNLIVPFKRPVYQAVLSEFQPRLETLGY
jgi:putative (di)nucleoside polyphosphate hydrolase